MAIFENLQPLNGILSKKDKILKKSNRKFAVGLYVKYVLCFLECILLVKCACYLLFVTIISSIYCLLPSFNGWQESNIGLHGHSIGSLTIDTSGIRWKSALDTGDDDVTLSKFMPKANIHSAAWTVFGKSGYLRILKKQQPNSKGDKESDLRFDGFPVSDFEKLISTLKAFYNVSLRKKTISSGGVSFGNTDLEKKQLVFKECILEDADEEGQEFEPRDGHEMLSLNLGEVAQCVIQGNTKNEIEVQFAESDTVEAGADKLTSIRFYIPPDPDMDPTETSKT